MSNEYYGDDGDFDEFNDYGDEEEEIQEYDDDYEYFDEEQFGVGYRQLDQIGFVQEMRTNIEGRGKISDIEKKLRFTGMNSRDRFLAGIHAMLSTIDIQDLGFDESNKKELIENVDTLTFTHFKNPLYYILGYYLSDSVPPEFSTDRAAKLRNVKRVLDMNSQVSQRQSNKQVIQNQMLANVIKYARFWQMNNMVVLT